MQAIATRISSINPPEIPKQAAEYTAELKLILQSAASQILVHLNKLPQGYYDTGRIIATIDKLCEARDTFIQAVTIPHSVQN